MIAYKVNAMLKDLSIMKISTHTPRALMLWVIGITLILIPATGGEVFANPKVTQLQQKMADITLLKQQLKEHSQKAESVLSTLLTQRNELVSEIRILVKSLNIKTFEQARQHLRIRYNMQLLRTLMAYVDRFDAKISFYQTGCDKLAYLHQLTTDDIKMATSMNDFQIDALTTQISLVINKYLPEAHAIQIDPKRMQPVSSEQVWDAVVNQRY